LAQVLGLTVLAWGNSVPDLITDVTMARTGFANMAMTACFAGPMCNMLTGLGLGFLALLRKSNAPTTPVHLSGVTLVDGLYLIANCAAFVAVGLAWHNRVPRHYALVLPCVYAVYLFMNLVLEWSQSQ
jgi:sodium/potassium/calcium exchanger 6